MMALNNLNHASDYEEKVQRCQEYIGALEEERRKIDVFQRELPLCLQLVTQAIETCKNQLTSGVTESTLHHGGQSECSEQLSRDEQGPVLEEFMPVKRHASSFNDEHDEQQSKKPNTNGNCDYNYEDIITKSNSKEKKEDDKVSQKSDWLRSAQLWNQTPDLTPKEESLKKVKVTEVKRNVTSGAFHPFKEQTKPVEASIVSAHVPSSGGGCKIVTTVAVTNSFVETGGNNGESKKEDKEEQSQKKHRRCWAPDLHKRFLKALQQLGGPHVATPKQIRELMKVDGLTNDEVKSHLQKYRLHSRRPSTSHNNTTTQPPQFVVVGGLWMPPVPEYAAAPPVTVQNKQLNSNCSHSSSSDTTTNSPHAAY